MINGFFQTVQDDLSFMSSYLSGKEPKQSELFFPRPAEERVKFVALRLLAVVGMAFAVVGGLQAIGAGLTIAGVSKGVLAVAGYVGHHDLFVMSCNADKLTDGVRAFSRTVFREVGERFFGNKDPISAPSSYITEGTFLRPMCDELIPELVRV